MFNNLIHISSGSAVASSSASSSGPNVPNLVFNGFINSLWGMVDWLPIWYFPAWFWISLVSIIGGYFIWFVYANFIK